MPTHFAHDNVRRESLKTKGKRSVGRSGAAREMSPPALTTVGQVGILQDRHAVRALQYRDVAVVTMSPDRRRTPAGNRPRAKERNRLDADRGRDVGRRRVDADVERSSAKQGARAAEREFSGEVPPGFGRQFRGRVLNLHLFFFGTAARKAMRKPSSTTLLATARQTSRATSLSEYLPDMCRTTKGLSRHHCESSADNAL